VVCNLTLRFILAILSRNRGSPPSANQVLIKAEGVTAQTIVEIDPDRKRPRITGRSGGNIGL